MGTKIFNRGAFTHNSELPLRRDGKGALLRWMGLSVLILLASFLNCSDGAINAYMEYEPNRAPEILELQSDFSGLPVPGDIITITCKTYDPDGNPLSYLFTSSQGSFTDQVVSEERSEIRFVIGNISGGEDVKVSVKVTDTKDASAAATLNIGRSSLGPVITIVKPVNTIIGADGYSTVTFTSNMDGFYQVDLGENGIPADEINPNTSLFLINKNRETVFNICGPHDSDNNRDKLMEGIPRLSQGTGKVHLKVMDRMGQVSFHEIVYDVTGTTPVIGDPTIRISDLEEKSMTLNWNLAMDLDNLIEDQRQQGMRYRVYISRSDNISRLEDVESSHFVLDWTLDLNHFTVTGLTPSTRYYFNVVVKDNDDVKEIYNSISMMTRERIPGSYRLRYDGNGATGGTVPDYARYYEEGQDVPVLDNEGNFAKTGYFFSCWNTSPDGSGTNYRGGESFTMGSADLVLYAVWKAGFVTRWKTDNPGISEDNQITIPVYSGEIYDYSVDWGDGSTDIHLAGSATHSYASPGTYTVSISGTFPRIYFNNSGDKDKILTIESWGEIKWRSMGYAFFGCINLTYNASDAPDLSGVTDMSGMFAGASSFNGDISGWDVSSAISMSVMFQGASSFNGDISGWDVSSVMHMIGMFASASSFNGDISGWDVSSVTRFDGMFREATSFNGDISKWDVSKVTDMSGMFQGASSFNGDICGWDVSSVTNMRYMFQDASAFSDHDLSGWNVTNVDYHENFSTGWGTGNSEPRW